jgi:GntR family transcriptional regulator of arabinose operon
MANQSEEINRTPLYQRVHGILRQRILNGEWAFGAMLSNEHDLCEQFGVSRGTIRQVLGELEKEGLIRREQGRGTFITRVSRQEPQNGVSGRSLAFIVPYVRDSFVPTILLGIESCARSRGYAVLFSHVENDLDKQETALKTAVSQGVAGIILYPVNSTNAGPFLSQLVSQNFPLVTVDRYMRGLFTDFVTSDNFGGGLQATRYLLSLGHRRIAFIRWDDPAVTMEHRCLGYRQALLEAGVDVDANLEWEVRGYPDVDISSLKDRLSMQPRPTAIFAGNDQVAMAVQRAAQSLKIQIPEELALVGFDDLDVSVQREVGLTTVAQPAYELGKIATEMVICRIEQVNPCLIQHVLPTRLVIRQSSGKSIQPNKEVI